ncbi:tyrosine-type recombinase/integrase [Roseivivax sp. THAF197b]|uniref:tyrosine-type recombinase/integrase n=1 Tax=Roseivivax sp. THAF197b TaxID=2588299 RepID=UPI00126869E0|nr:tyrosine-type recombinase/integrase [Roseivivax sp. THAF197b]QFS85208.1 Tyrosine recombinase XerD [Roseivivax sp. THAF197b]
MIATYPFAAYVQRFFTERLLTQMQASPNTIASYRDTFRLLLKYAAAETKLPPTDLHVAHIDADIVGRFLTFCEDERGNSARSRNTRLAAIRSFFKYVAGSEPHLLHHCQKVLAMPSKRHEKRVVDFLNRGEMELLLKAPDQSTWFGWRDWVLLLTLLQTGLRVSELISLRIGDVELGTGAHLRCMGKGRKERATPLRADSREALRAWLAQIGAEPNDPLFATIRGKPLSRDAVERIVRKHAATAASENATFRLKRVTPHVLRHTAAMQLLQSGVDRTIIALWLGHESIETTQVYIHADIELKERAMALTKPVDQKTGRYRPGDELLSFLEAL